MPEIEATNPLIGRCLCGAVRVTVDGPPVATGNCHCLDCRKFFGAAHVTIAVFPEDAVIVTGTVSAYTQPGGSGEAFTRHFCPTCAGPIFGESKAIPGRRMVPLAVLDNAEAHGLAPQFSMFTRSAATWDMPHQDLPGFESGPGGE